jgi:hypothetical protein
MARGRGLQVGSINVLPSPTFQPNCKKLPFYLQKKIFSGLKNGVPRFFASCYFHESTSPKSLKIKLGSFQIFSKIQDAPPVSTTTLPNLPPVSTTHQWQVPYRGVRI